MDCGVTFATKFPWYQRTSISEGRAVCAGQAHRVGRMFECGARMRAVLTRVKLCRYLLPPQCPARASVVCFARVGHERDLGRGGRKAHVLARSSSSREQHPDSAIDGGGRDAGRGGSGAGRNFVIDVHVIRCGREMRLA